ncbi:MAG: hypothetical protein CBE33_05230 [Candidatus Pelagibacter sp. TMED273]|nr:MAG: hypothetical protein CBE33_05230 [Candidatus Pelagibacter sp. TMED273]
MKKLQGFVEKRIQEIKETEIIKQPEEERKTAPIYSGVLRYFPDAIKEVARCSYKGNIQHNPNKKLHWDRSKSGDELDALTRHLLQAGTIDTDGVRHSVKVAWRALANLQKELEQIET